MSTVLNIAIADTPATLASAISTLMASTQNASAPPQPQKKPNDLSSIAPFITVVAEPAENPQNAVNRFNPIASVTLLSHDGAHLVRCNLQTIMSNVDNVQQQQHPLAPLLHVLSSPTTIKVLSDGRGIQDAIASDLRTFDTALLSNVVDLAVLPIYFGYADRYQPRFQRGVLRLPSLTEAASFLRVPTIAAPKLLNFVSSSTLPHSELEPVIKKLWAMRSLANAQLSTAALGGAATTPGTTAFLMQKEQRAVHAAEAASNRRAKQGLHSNGKDSKGKNEKANGSHRGGPSSSNELRKAMEAAAATAYTAAIAVTDEDTQKLSQIALGDILATSRRFIDTLGSYQHPQILKKRQDPTADDSDARAQLQQLLDPRGGYYLPFGVIQPLTSHVNRRAANHAASSRSHNHHPNSNGKQEDAAQILLSKQTKLFEEESFRHQQAIEAQRRDAATTAAKGNSALSSAVKSVLGVPTPPTAEVGRTESRRSEPAKEELLPATASASTSSKKKRKDKAHHKAALGDTNAMGGLHIYFRTNDESTNKNTNPNKPLDDVALCTVCYLPFTTKVSPHHNQQQQQQAAAGHQNNTICANCIERALPCEFYRRGCCKRKDGECDYVHAYVPCPYGAQCIRHAIERFTAANTSTKHSGDIPTTSTTSTASSSIVNGSSPQTPNSLVSSIVDPKRAVIANASKNSGCCPFIHPGEAHYIAPTVANASTTTTTGTGATKAVDGEVSNSKVTSFTVSASSPGTTDASSHSAGLSATTLFEQMAPSLVNPATGEVGLQTKRRGGRCQKSVAAVPMKAADATLDNNSIDTSASEAVPLSAANAPQVSSATAFGSSARKVGLCHMHFYSPGGCPNGRRCQLSHEPIPLFVPIPVVRQ